MRYPRWGYHPLNEGWIEFENGGSGSRNGEVALETMLQSLLEREIKP
jgi:hypothetical protein